MAKTGRCRDREKGWGRPSSSRNCNVGIDGKGIEC
jgi:hypothetical protein